MTTAMTTRARRSKRIQLRRTKGWRKPVGSVVVTRSTKWGNPFALNERIDRDDWRWPWLRLPTDPPEMLRGLASLTIVDPRRAVDTYTYWLYEQPGLMLSLAELVGYDLACWCPIGSPCHADVLLALASGPEDDEAEGSAGGPTHQGAETGAVRRRNPAMMTKDRLFEVAAKERWTGSKALVPQPSDACPSCGGELDAETVDQRPLMRHGGYGAAQRTTMRHCPCGWRMQSERSEVKP